MQKEKRTKRFIVTTKYSISVAYRASLHPEIFYKCGQHASTYLRIQGLKISIWEEKKFVSSFTMKQKR